MEKFSNFLMMTFMPHGHCYLWKPSLVNLHLISDTLITIAYFSIPLVLISLLKQRKDIPFHWIFLLFASFILCCGLTHAFEVVTLWYPVYWLSGTLKAITAFISVLTAFELFQLRPQILAFPSPAQLEKINISLKAEIEERLQAEQALRQREAELKAKNEELEQTLFKLQRTQSHLFQSEKMSSLGQMIAEIAHEINNPLNYIYGNLVHAKYYTTDCLNLLQLYRQTYPEPPLNINEFTETIDVEFIEDDLPKLLDSMKMGAERIRTLVFCLLNFSRQDQVDKKPVNIHDGLESTLLILSNRLKIRENQIPIKIVKQYGLVPDFEGYPSQLNQVFTNLISNAIDALEEYNGTRTAQEIQDYPSQITITTKLTVDDWVEIRIADNGPGIPESLKAMLFQPFFTTKPEGKGTGLGLAISYQIIVEKHEGELICNSQLGKGTEFIIKLPYHPVQLPQKRQRL